MSKKPTPVTSRWQSVGRKALVTSLITALACGFSACEKNKTDVAPTVTEDPTLTRILALGFDKKNIVDKGTHYLVEGDIRFDKQAAGTTSATQPGVIAQSQDQSHTWELILYDKQPVLTYRVNSQSLPSAAINNAVSEWNNVPGCRIHLTPTNGPADITFISGDLDAGTYGQGDFPKNGSPGAFVTIDINQITFNSPDPGTIKLVLVHELGHVFGFRHTDWVGKEPESGIPDIGHGNANGAVVINGTPATDANSVMNTGNAPNHGPTAVWVGFSTNDIIGFQNLYPVYAASISGSGYYKILNRATGKSIDVSGGGSNRDNGVQIVQWGDGGSQSEQWSIQSNGDDHYKIVNRVTNRSIDVNGGSTVTGTDVPLVQWDNGSAQNWRFQDVGGGYYKIVNRYTNKCMDVSGGGSNSNNGVPLVQYYYQGHDSQQWRLAQ
jgi:hypothetical protein